LGVSILKNQAFPKYLELEKQSVIAKINGDKSFRPRRSGVKIKSIPPTSGAHRKLKNKDVIMAVDGIPVGPDSKLLLKNGERVDIPWYISSLFEEDILQFTISRKEKGMDVSVPLTPMDVRSGVMIESIAPYSGAFGKLHSKDVIKTLDGIPVGADGKIPFRRGERVDLSCYISSLFEGDVLKVTIWRNGEEMDVSVPLKLSRMDYLVPSRLHNKPPPYLI
jgi:S1-C subfamily serine protease